ncbi:hypothetical protein CKA32_001039 [Geitlerinema sp. FC II]|nr:hypothetical protein CKA32_001039 [Geitlerinema sp. FC II]
MGLLYLKKIETFSQSFKFLESSRASASIAIAIKKLARDRAPVESQQLHYKDGFN